MKRRDLLALAAASPGVELAPLALRTFAAPIAGRVLLSPVLISASGGMALFAAPTTAHAFDPFTLAVLLITGLAGVAVGWDQARTEMFAERSNWEPNPNGSAAGQDLHARLQAPVSVRSESRFLERNNGVTLDTRDGTVQLIAPSNSAGKFKRDISALEAPVVKGTPFPLTERLEPNAEARRHLERAWGAMGGKFGSAEASYMRMFADSSGEERVRISNGSTSEHPRALLVERAPRG